MAVVDTDEGIAAFVHLVQVVMLAALLEPVLSGPINAVGTFIESGAPLALIRHNSITKADDILHT